MTKPITDYTTEELSTKIEALKAERERTANALRRYEEELERKKQEVPLGVPAERRAYKEAYFVNCTGRVVNQPLDPNDKYDKEIFDMLDVFTSEASAKKHIEMLLAWRKALVANSKGEPIDILVLLPLLKKGKVAFCPISQRWFWTNEIPQLMNETWGILGDYGWIGGFNLKPAENWETSLMECGL